MQKFDSHKLAMTDEKQVIYGIKNKLREKYQSLKKNKMTKIQLEEGMEIPVLDLIMNTPEN